jgi:hypothetical protein
MEGPCAAPEPSQGAARDWHVNGDGLPKEYLRDRKGSRQSVLERFGAG